MFCSLLVTCSRRLQITKKWKLNTLTLLSASRSDEETPPLSQDQRTETASLWSCRQQCDLSMHERPFISAGRRGASIIIICCLGYMSQCETLSSSAWVLYRWSDASWLMEQTSDACVTAKSCIWCRFAVESVLLQHCSHPLIPGSTCRIWKRQSVYVIENYPRIHKCCWTRENS